MTEIRPFTPDEKMTVQLATNRAGRFTTAQRIPILIAALITTGGLVFMGLMLLTLINAASDGMRVGGVISFLFIVMFLLTFGYMGLSLYFNARHFVPEIFMRQPVRQARGKLQIKKPQRERPEFPFSYIVGDYSFAPYMVPYEVPMDVGREYIVYYAARSRVFLSIEPVDYHHKAK